LKFEPNQKGKSYGLALTQNATEARFPQLDAVRIYISLHKQLIIDTNEHGIPIAVSADNPAPGNPNYLTLSDFVEATWHEFKDYSILHVNTTQVDAFGLAFEVEHRGKDPSSPDKPMTIINGFESQSEIPTRRLIFEALSQKSSPWPALVVKDPNGNPVRALAPIKALDQGKFPKDWLDESISNIEGLYRDFLSGNKMHFTHENIQYSGAAPASQNYFLFHNANGKRYTIPFPTTRQCLANDIKVEPEDGTGSALAAAFCATILRGTLGVGKSDLVPVPQEQRSEYYTAPHPFEYAKIIHQYGINNHAFCFGYDEVAGDAGKNRDVRDPEFIKLIIQPA
jgi:Beta-1,3-glucanase